MYHITGRRLQNFGMFIDAAKKRTLRHHRFILASLATVTRCGIINVWDVGWYSLVES